MSGYKGILNMRPEDAMTRGGLIAKEPKVSLGSGWCPIGYRSSFTSALQLDAILVRGLEDYSVERFGSLGKINLRDE